ncbi:MAG: hypothetical protein PUP93_20595 [Rhizonema sp. NSF051]|nr:hypothetical protein [Rhizonema sp. NSF051]
MLLETTDGTTRASVGQLGQLQWLKFETLRVRWSSTKVVNCALEDVAIRRYP